MRNRILAVARSLVAAAEALAAIQRLLQPQFSEAYKKFSNWRRPKRRARARSTIKKLEDLPSDAVLAVGAGAGRERSSIVVSRSSL
jgi:hypothetical protein